MVIASLIEGCILGLGAAIPLGPINILIMNHALHSYRDAVVVGAGAISADITYLLFILFGFFHFIDQPMVLHVMAFAGSFFLAYMSWTIWKNRHQTIHSVSLKPKALFAHYIKGYTLTLINPYTLVFWFSVSTYIATRNLDIIATMVGLLFSTSLWVSLMPLVIHKTKHLISQRVASIFSIGSALILLFFAMGMFWTLFP